MNAEVRAVGELDAKAIARRVEWQSIVEAHDRRVLLLLLAMGLRLDHAKDVAQSTWLRLMEQQRAGKLERLDFPGLALKQARFLALDELKRRGRTTALGSGEHALEALGVGADEQLIQREELERAVSAFASCSESARKVFLAAYEEPGAPHAEVAKRLGLSVQRVRQVICEVRKKLRDAMEPQGGER